MMTCPHIDRTGAYLDGALAAAEHRAFAAHLASCAVCAQELARLQRLGEFFAAAGQPEFEWRGVLWKVRAERQRLVRFAELLMGAAAVVIAACSIALLNSSAPDANADSWERVAITHQLERAPAPEDEDPILQVLLREQP